MKHELGEIDTVNPFSKCKLERKKYAEILTELVENNSEGFVMSLNSPWGTGKTTFVKMWEQHMRLEEIPTIYFNAWENDFEDNPLTAIIGELKSVIKPESQNSFNKVLEKGLILSKHILPTIIKALINKYVDSTSIKDSLEKIAEDSQSLYNNEVDEYINRKESIKEFRNYLSKYVADTVTEKPLVFIIDELDRCRPNYSVSLLEQIKHFFNVPNIVFVLSIDKIQLENAIKGVYGTDLIDSEEYLRRFIDIEYSLPKPESRAFCQYLFKQYKFEDFFVNKHKNMIGNNYDFFSDFTILISEHANLSLRQQEKFINHLNAVLKTCRPQRQIIITLFITLVYLKSYYNSFYIQLRNKKISIETLQNILLEIFPKDSLELRFLNNIEANLIFFYRNYYSRHTPLIEFIDGNDKLTFNALYDKEQLTNTINSLENNHYDFQVSSIEKIMDRIDLFSQD